MPPPGPAGGASQGTLRETNLRLVTRTVLESPVPPSRADVAQRTRLTRSTVSRLVDDLLGGGVLAETEAPGPVRSGRPGTPLVAGPVAALGMLVNVAGLVARVVDLGGRVLAEGALERDLRGGSADDVLTDLAALARRVLDDVPPGVALAGARLALPGVVGTASDTLLVAPNLGWSEVTPRTLLTPAALGGLRLRLGNEADLAARTVAAPAPGREGPLRDFLYVSGEVGIGGAVVVGGSVLTGRHGWAGEIGHVCVDPHGPPCRCGSTGCLERYVGRDELAALVGVDPAVVGQVLPRLVADGDPAASAAVERAVWALGIALAGAVNLIDTPAIVLGGHLAQVGDLLCAPLEATLARRVLSSRWVPPVVRAAGGGPAPAATGAALAELDDVVERPFAWLQRNRLPQSGSDSA
ncbi:ROK family transcriptional regulator [Phycicoccus sp. MQZ13P-5]|uniref:ROK family transcriptional regulator n=1 Tax=Phycicoccus sonneratiae TaxID=2807628 RepID=A0ABS2CQJ6_9MICO|nr:ROK family transcriptional regulator [Phycicoccus sonneraticus]